MNADVLHLGDEVQDVAAMVTFREAVPAVLTDAHPELGGVGALVDGAGTAETVITSLELINEAVMLNPHKSFRNEPR